MTDMEFKDKKEFLDWIDSIKNCVKESGYNYCPNIFDHYERDDKGKKIKKKLMEPVALFIGETE